MNAMTLVSRVFSQSFLAVWLACFSVIALDQLSKWMLVSLFALENKPIRVAPFCDMVMVWNRGISFGLMNHGSGHPWVLSALAIVIIGFLLYYLRNVYATLALVAGGLIIGGAFSNVIDRFHFGAVADFFSFHVAGFYWPAFNVSDSAVCVGAFLLAAYNMKDAKKTSFATPAHSAEI